MHPKLRYKFLPKGRPRGKNVEDKTVLCNNFSFELSTYALGIYRSRTGGRPIMNMIYVMCLNRKCFGSVKPNDFRFINLGIKSRIYCTRKELPAFRRRPKSLLKSTLAGLWLDVKSITNPLRCTVEWKHHQQQRQRGGKNPICTPITVNFNLRTS